MKDIFDPLSARGTFINDKNNWVAMHYAFRVYILKKRDVLFLLCQKATINPSSKSKI